MAFGLRRPGVWLKALSHNGPVIWGEAFHLFWAQVSLSVASSPAILIDLWSTWWTVTHTKDWNHYYSSDQRNDLHSCS